MKVRPRRTNYWVFDRWEIMLENRTTKVEAITRWGVLHKYARTLRKREEYWWDGKKFRKYTDQDKVLSHLGGVDK